MLLSLSVLSLDAETLTITGPLSVVDGDTLSIGPVQIRLFGIDAPEAGQKCSLLGGGEWACGRDATRYLDELTKSGLLDCVPDSSDPYGRIISFCSVDGKDLGEMLVESGMAWAFVEYSDIFVEQEKIARDAGLGVFQAPSQTPWEYRADAWERAVQSSPNGCPIKGNVNGSARIYHTPWSPNYGQTKIDDSKGERWFCDEAEALAKGWVARR
ncbi:MAG: thermonuclease family protein [Sulfitobacter sp.]